MCGLCESLGIDIDYCKPFVDDREMNVAADNYATYGGGGAGHLNGFWGKRHSNEAKKLMSMAKKGLVTWNKGVKGYKVHTDESKAAMGKKLAGEGNGRCVLGVDQVTDILNEYAKRPTMAKVNEIQQNGKSMSYMWAFCLSKGEEYGVTAAAVKNIILGKTWKHLERKYTL